MAYYVTEGAKAAGAEVDVFTSAEFSADKAGEYPAIAFGCPSMGAEQLEEREKLGMEQGMEQGIRAFILDHIEEGTPKNIILQKLEKRFSLSPEQAEEYFCRFREG